MKSSTKRSTVASILSTSIRISAVLAGVLSAGCSVESTAVTQCRLYQNAYCDSVARCTNAAQKDLFKQTCVAAFSAAADCSKATEVTSGFDACLGALGSDKCDPMGPTECAGVAMRFPDPMPKTCTRDPSATPDAQGKMLASCPPGTVSSTQVDARLRRDLDVLFLIDNSPSMSPKQGALTKNIPKFIKQLDATGANYHIGIATSDIGSNTAPGVPWGGNIGSCDTFEGDDGGLQAVSCDTRTQVTPGARMACAELCPDSKFVPTDGRRYISKIDGITNVPSKLELDPSTGKMVDTGPERAFRCMALVGDAGCGIESPLEGAKRALDGHNPMNTGFLRANSLLAVVFITDEDDCSVQMARRSENNPLNRDCDPMKPDEYDCYNVDYRCFARSLQCNESLLTTGIKTGCMERPNNYLESVDKYVKFFQALRRPDRLLVSGIWTLPPIQGGGKVEISRGSGGTTTPFLNRAGGSGASCTYDGNMGIYGQAQLRLSKFASQLPGSIETSICKIDNYNDALDQIAARVTSKLTATCLPKTPRTVAGKPDCLVGDVDEGSASAPSVAMPVCGIGCCGAWASTSQPTPADPAVQAACASESADCYCALPSTVPGVCAGSAIAGVWRKGGAQPPAGKVTSMSCVNQ